MKSMGILFSGMMFLSAAACGSNAGDTADGAAKQADVQTPAGKKVLVAYYSALRQHQSRRTANPTLNGRRFV